MKISLSPELEWFVKAVIDSGRFKTESEVVGAALRLLVTRQSLIDDLEHKIDGGLDDAVAGRTHSPDEARAIHHGDAKERQIYGEATLEDARDLIEEGIAVAPLPSLPRADS